MEHGHTKEVTTDFHLETDFLKGVNDVCISESGNNWDTTYSLLNIDLRKGADDVCFTAEGPTCRTRTRSHTNVDFRDRGTSYWKGDIFIRHLIY